jgi:dTDP-4-dehydrorhamnose reductase
MGRVLVVGALGQLGTDSVRAFEEAGYETIGPDRDRLDLAKAEEVAGFIAGIDPEVVVNAAAMTDVPGCETDPIGAYIANALGPRNLAIAAAATGARLLHVSTDYVFDGAKRTAYTENDLPGPLNAYGNTKLSGEYFVLAHAPGSVVVRTSGLYGRAPCRGKGGRNFVQSMLGFARDRGEARVVTDEVVTPTYTVDLARQLVAIARADIAGVVHATCRGECSWYEFAREIFDLSGLSPRLVEATTADFPSTVTRPRYSVLANDRLRAAGLDRMRPWREALASYLEEIGERAPTAVPPGRI